MGSLFGVTVDIATIAAHDDAYAAFFCDVISLLPTADAFPVSFLFGFELYDQR
jgi:hypothetical protein